MPSLKPYTGDAKLVVAFDIGTTFSNVSYCILEQGQVPKIDDITRRVLHFFVLTYLDWYQVSWAAARR